MQTAKTLIALLAISSLLLAVAPMAMSLEGHGWGGKGGMLRNIDEVYESVAYVGTEDGVTTLNILNAAIKDKSGNVTAINFTRPITVRFYGSNNTAVVTGIDKTALEGLKLTRASYGSAAINPSDASGVVALKNITMLKMDDKTAEFQFTGISVYLPDGSVKQYSFAMPVKAVKSLTGMTTKIDNPAVIADIQDAFKGGAKFPANAKPVSLKAIDSK